MWFVCLILIIENIVNDLVLKNVKLINIYLILLRQNSGITTLFVSVRTVDLSKLSL